MVVTHDVITVYPDGSLSIRMKGYRKTLYEANYRSWASLLFELKHLDYHSTPLYVRPTRAKGSVK